MQSSLPIVESFHSIQGEGAHVGKSAFFIRLASCNVGCTWCDTKNSWSINYPTKTVNEISKEVASANQEGASFVVITGGEPLHHDLNPLCNAIRAENESPIGQPIGIHLETSGVNELSGHPNWITLSPKPHAKPRLELLAACQELKVIINKSEDLLFAEEMSIKALEARQSLLTTNPIKSNDLLTPLLFLQPCWGNQLGMQLAIDYVKRNPKWRMSMQTHKWLGVE